MLPLLDLDADLKGEASRTASLSCVPVLERVLTKLPLLLGETSPVVILIKSASICVKVSFGFFLSKLISVNTNLSGVSFDCISSSF